RDREVGARVRPPVGGRLPERRQGGYGRFARGVDAPGGRLLLKLPADRRAPSRGSLSRRLTSGWSLTGSRRTLPLAADRGRPAAKEVPRARGDSPRLDGGGGARDPRPAALRAGLSRADGAPRGLRPPQDPALFPALDQDGGLRRGLRLLPAGGALPHRRQGPAADAGRGGVAAGARGQGDGGHALL